MNLSLNCLDSQNIDLQTGDIHTFKESTKF